MTTFYDTTAKRLRDYYSFSDQTIDAVAHFAEKQESYKTYQDFFTAVGMTEAKIHRIGKKQGAVVIDITPKKPAKRTIVMHLPMGNPLDPNQQYQLATIAGLFPDTRVIGFANPSGGPYAHVEHDLSILQKLGIATGANVKSLVAAEIDYLVANTINEAYFAGYSYGALKALIASKYAPRGMVKGMVTVELVSHPRSPLKLIRDFNNTLPPLGSYVHATNLKTFQDARDNSIGGRDYHKGLRRSINLSIGSLISRLNSLKLAKSVVKQNPALHLTMAWGTKSELVDDVRMRQVIEAMNIEFPGRVVGIPLDEHKHGLANDVHLHAAIIYEALLQNTFS